MDVYSNIKALGLELPQAPSKGGLYEKMVRVGESIYYTSGVGCKKNNEFLFMGQIGDTVTVEEGQMAARQCILNLLSNIEEAIGNLNDIKKIVKMLGFVSSCDGFGDQPKVMNAASSLLVDIFGESIGSCARSAIGVNTLPGNQSVEIELVFETK